MNGAPCTTPVHFEMEPDSIIVLPDEFDVEVRCLSGALWIAQLDNLHDLAMHAGDRAVIGKGKSSIINATAAASLQIHFCAYQQCHLTWDFSRRYFELRYATARQALKVRGKCRIRFEECGAAMCIWQRGVCACCRGDDARFLCAFDDVSMDVGPCCHCCHKQALWRSRKKLPALPRLLALFNRNNRWISSARKPELADQDSMAGFG